MFAVLHIADFALQAVLRTTPESEPGPRPAALFAATTKKSLLLAANAAARQQGVEPGMTAPQAVARCPALLIRTPQPEAEAEARAALLAIGFTVSPALEDTAPGVCTADLQGHLTPPRALLATALQQLAALGLPATAGIARTPLLALLAARAVEAAPLTEAGAAVETDRASLWPAAIGPARMLLVEDGAAFLAPLPLAVAEPSPELAEVLASWGLRTLGDLTALPRDDLVRRFGAAGLALWQRASGGEARPLRRVLPAQQFQARMEFEHAIETLEPLLFILRRFVERLALELQVAQLVAAELELTLQLEDETHYARAFRLPEPSADQEILFRTLHTHLETVQTTSALTAVALRLTPARPLVRQQGLFETGLRDPHGFAETLARLVALVGSERVGTPQLEDTFRPDAVKLVPPGTVVPPPAAPPVHPRLGLPLRRFRPPRPAQLEFTGEQPTYVWADGVRGEITARSAGWISNGDWWQADRAWGQREWDIALAGGGLYRLILVGESYFLEGEYD